MNTSSTADTSGLRCYDKVVDDVTYKIPRGITRDARGGVWIVRVLKNKQLRVHARFTDKRFDSPQRALDAAIIHLIHSGHARLEDEVLRLSERTVVHWRKRSGIGLCAVAYVTGFGHGRGMTFFLSTYKRVASGRGMGKFRGKLQQVLEHDYQVASEGIVMSQSALDEIHLKLDRLWEGPVFKDFIKAGARKADQIAISEYVESISAS
jgi:hypothetical protein